MLFCDQIGRGSVGMGASQAEALRACRDFDTDFSLSFPSLSYRPVPDARLINAQAVTTASGRYINIYGGLIFHPSIGADYRINL
jgi:hypothetical protein